jgi:hypothetical protein
MGCGCLLAVIAAFAPRITLFFVWVFTPYVTRAFTSFIWPLLGIIFLPYTTLIYTLVWVPGIGVTGWRWAWVVIGVLLDISTHGGGLFSRRHEAPA